MERGSRPVTPQSQTWNGQEPAFHIYITILAALIFVSRPDGDLA